MGWPGPPRTWGACALAFVGAAATAAALAPLETPLSGAETTRGLLPWLVASGVAWAGLGVLAWALARGVAPGARKSILLLLLGAALLRAFVVLTAAPALSDDLWRYIRDGAVLLEGENPYRTAPARGRAAGRQRYINARVNHPHLPTVYQPPSQLLFAGFTLGWRAAPQAWRALDPLRHRTYRLGFAAIDLLLIGVLLATLQRGGHAPLWAALYAWHPLPLTEIAGSGHQDGVGALLLLLALLLVGGARRGGALRRGVAGGVTAACAAAFKPVIAPALLPAARALPWRGLLLGAAAGGAGVAALYAPFLLMPAGMEGMIASARAMATRWSFNAPVHGPLAMLLGRDTASAACALLFLGTAIYCMMRVEAVAGARTILTALLLLSSTVHPWYLLWALPLLVLRFEPVLWIWSVTALLAYTAHAQLTFAVPTWALGLEYAPVGVALLWSAYRARPVVVRGEARGGRNAGSRMRSADCGDPTSKPEA